MKSIPLPAVRINTAENNNTLLFFIRKFVLSALCTLSFTVVTTAQSASLQTINVKTQSFSGIKNTKAISLSTATGNADNKPYFAMIAGDRNAMNLNRHDSNATTIINTEIIKTGTQVSNASNSFGGFTLISNPYLAPVNFSRLKRVHLANRFYAWDPNFNQQGAFVVIDDIDNDGKYSTSSALSFQNKTLESGQAVFVQTDTIGAASITWFENSKTIREVPLNFQPAGQTRSIDMMLNIIDKDGTVIPADGALVEYSDDYCGCVNFQDASKFTNIDETFSLVRNNIPLSIERRPVINSDDTLYLRLVQSAQKNYQLVFRTNNLSQPGLSGFLEDKYAGTATPVNTNGITVFNFNINADSASGDPDRFRIVFKEAGMPNLLNDIQATRLGEGITVSWNVQNQLDIQRYLVEKGTGDGYFKLCAIQLVKDRNKTHQVYQWQDTHPNAGDNFYRIKATRFDGIVFYTKVVVISGDNISQASAVATTH